MASLLLALLLLQNANAQVIVGGAITQALTAEPGNAERGRALVASRQTGLCLLCHSGPFPEERFQGNLAPELTMTVARLDVGQLRARIINAAHFNPQTIMPAYYQTTNLNRVASKFVGQTILSGQEIEDVIAFLMSLKTQTSN